MNLKEKIEKRAEKVAIVGLGYVGLPLAVEYASKGINVLGIDVDPEKASMINAGENYIGDVEDAKLRKAVEAGNLKATTSYSDAAGSDVYFICVPTPFTPNKEPDVSYIEEASAGIATVLARDNLVILKSTTFPETTEKVVQPILEKSGLKAGSDFYLAFSPERIDPGNQTFNTTNTPVIVGGINKPSTDVAVAVSQQTIDQVVPVSSPRVGEMAKLLENIFRSVNIALLNELTQLTDRMGGIDIWEVIHAAGTKPFGFMPFYPGPGIGGHCILVDPYYLSWKAKEYDFHTKFIELAAETNENMPYYVLDLIIRSLSINGGALKTSKYLFLGAAFKKNVDDIRNSPALKVMELLFQRGAQDIQYNDPYVPELHMNGHSLRSLDLSAEVIAEMDCVVIATNHDDYDLQMIVDSARLIVDTRNATQKVGTNLPNVVRLGYGS